MMMKPFLGGALICLIPLCANANPSSPIGMLSDATGVAAVDLDAGRIGSHITWAGYQVSGEKVTLNGLQINSPDRVVTINRALLGADGISATGVGIAGPDEKLMFSSLSFDQVEMTGAQAYALLFNMNEYCNSAVENASTGRFPIANVTFRGATLTPPSMPGDDIAFGRAPEKISMTSGQVGLVSAEGSDCVSISSGQLSGLTVISAGSDIGVVSAMGYEAQDAFSRRITASGVNLMSGSGRRVLSVDAAEVHAEATRPFLDGLLAEGSSFSRPSGLIDLLTAGAFSASVKISGLDVTADLSEPGSGSYRGDILANLTSDGKIASFTHSADFAGLYGATVGLKIGISDEASGAASFISGLRGGSDKIDAAGRISLISGEFGYEDRGLDALAKEVTGSGLGPLILMAERFTDRIPEDISKPVFAWLSSVVGSQGHARFEPASPVDLMELGLQSMLSASRIPALLELELSEKYKD